MLKQKWRNMRHTHKNLLNDFVFVPGIKFRASHFSGRLLSHIPSSWSMLLQGWWPQTSRKQSLRQYTWLSLLWGSEGSGDGLDGWRQLGLSERHVGGHRGADARWKASSECANDYLRLPSRKGISNQADAEWELLMLLFSMIVHISSIMVTGSLHHWFSHTKADIAYSPCKYPSW